MSNRDQVLSNDPLASPEAFGDIRIGLTKVPEFTCPEENLKIPDVNSELQKMLLPESSPSTTLE